MFCRWLNGTTTVKQLSITTVTTVIKFTVIRIISMIHVYMHRLLHFTIVTIIVQFTIVGSN